MPLSEHEQRVLAQMEKALYAEDPRLVSTLQSTTTVTVDRRRLVLGILLALGGLALVVFGVMSNLIWLGAAGFVLMVVGGVLAASPSRGDRRKPGSGPTPGGQGVPPTGRAPQGPGAKSKGPRRGSGSTGFMDRMEQQWDKRREQGPF